MPPGGQIGFRCVLCLSAVPLAECRLLHCYHGFCDGCMRDWLESNRVGPQRRLKRLHCPTCRQPARESDLGRIFVEAVVLDEDAEYQANLVNAITEQTNSVHDSIRIIDPSSSALQVTRAISSVVQSRDALSTSQYAETEPITRSVMERLSNITNDLEHRVRPVFEKVARQGQQVESLKSETIQLKGKIKTIDAEKRQVESYLEEALQVGERLREDKDSAKLVALQKGQEVESLSKEVARLIRQAFTKGNEMADLKGQYDESQAEIERLNELLKASERSLNSKRRLDEMDESDTPLNPCDQSTSTLRPVKRMLVSRTRDGVATLEKPILWNTAVALQPGPWKNPPTPIAKPFKSFDPPKPNPFCNPSKEIRATLTNTSPDRRRLFQSDWNLDHLKKKRNKSEASLPFKVDFNGKPLVRVALGSRQRMTSKS